MASIKHIKQGKNECFPTVLAMLTGKSVDEIIASARIISPLVHSWDEARADSDLDGNAAMVYRHLARKYAPYLLDYVAPVNVKNISERKLFMPYATFVEATRQGRGAVVMCSRFISRPAGHIAAFENGLIYCGNMEGPMPAYDYYKLLASKTVLCPFAVISEY